MQNDEQTIRDLVAKWNGATIAGDIETICGMIADDAVFHVAGRDPFGKEAFVNGFRAGLEQVRIDVRSEIEELHVAGDFARQLLHVDAQVVHLLDQLKYLVGRARVIDG